MLPFPPALEPLVARLEVIRARLQFRRWLEGATWLLLLVNLVWIGFQVWGWLRGTDELAVLKLVVSTALVFFGLVGIGIYLCRTAPELTQLAQFTEQKLKLRERLSTSLEVEASTYPAQQQIHQALLQDALRHSEGIDPAQVVPLTLPKASRFLLLGLVVAGLLTWFPRNIDTPTSATIKEQAQVVAALKTLIEAVQHEAERTSDPYLQAEARNLEQLRTQIQKGKSSGQTAQQELEASLDRLGQSYGLAPTTQNPTGSEKARASGSASTSPAQNSNPSSASNSQGLSKRMERLTQAIKTQQTAGGSKPQEATGEASRECIFIEGYECLTPDQLAKLQQGTGSAGDRIRVQGPEGDSPGGSGDKAGKGAQAKLGSKQNLPKKAAPQQVVLPKHSSSSSLRRIQISAPTQLAQLQPASSAQAGGWHFGEEIPVQPGLQSLDSAARAVVSQYFAPKEE